MRASRILLCAAAGLASTGAALAQGWDLAQDFSDTNNPDPPWSFLFTSAVAMPPLGPTLCTAGEPPTLAGCVTEGWQQTVPGGNLPAAYSGIGRNGGATPLSRTHNNGATTTVPPGAVAAHVGEGFLVRWTAPAADTYRVRIELAPASPSTSCFVFVNYDGTQVFPSAGHLFRLPANGFTWTQDFVASAPGARVDLALGTGNLTVESTNFLVDMRVTPAALWQNIGSGCGPSFPWISGDARMTPGASSGVWLGGPTNTLGFLPVSFGAPGQGSAFGPCTVWVEPGFALLGPFVTDLSGTWFEPLQVPNNASIVGLELTFQGAFATGSTPLFWELTEGLYGRVGLWN